MIAGLLGVVAVTVALVRARAVALVAALLLAAGTAYLVAWLLDPPSLIDADGEAVGFGSAAYAAVVLLAIACGLAVAVAVEPGGLASGR